MPKKSKRQKVKMPQALELLAQEEAARLVDMEKVAHEAINRAEQSGIVFIDEIDKIARPDCTASRATFSMSTSRAASSCVSISSASGTLTFCRLISSA